MARRFQYDGVTWEVELAGPGTIGCSVRRVEVTFTSPSQGIVVNGRVTMAGDGRLTDHHLATALAEALGESPAHTSPTTSSD